MKPNDTGATKSCAYCGRENEYYAVHCRECGTNEFVYPKSRASAQAQTERAAGSIWRVRANRFVLVGAWVLFFPKFIVSFFAALGILTFGTTGPLDELWLTLADAAAAFVILYQVTRNYRNISPTYWVRLPLAKEQYCEKATLVAYGDYPA
jgi:hypothetical protein